MEQFQIGCLLKMITDKIKMRADADLAQQGLTLTQSRVLGYLSRMEQNGFVRCWLDPADKRSKIVGQTERAAAIAHEMQATINATEQQMLHSLTPDEIAALESALRTIYADLG